MINKSLMSFAKDYYRGERVSNAVLVAFGVLGMCWTLAVYMWRHGHLSTGMFYSALPLAIFLILTGSYRFVRSFRRYSRIQKGQDFYIKTTEVYILQDRLKRFRTKRLLDLAMIVSSLIVILLGLALHWHHITVGTALSILICSAVLLIYDLFGQFRTEEFLHHATK